MIIYAVIPCVQLLPIVIRTKIPCVSKTIRLAPIFTRPSDSRRCCPTATWLSTKWAQTFPVRKVAFEEDGAATISLVTCLTGGGGMMLFIFPHWRRNKWDRLYLRVYMLTQLFHALTSLVPTEHASYVASASPTRRFKRTMISNVSFNLFTQCFHHSTSA